MRDAPWHAGYQATNSRRYSPGTARLVDSATQWAGWHGTGGTIGLQAGVQVDDHITMHWLGLLDQ